MHTVHIIYLHKIEVKIYMEFRIDKSGQGGIISFFIMSMLAVIVSLSVTWPVIDTALNVGNVTANMSTSAQTLVQMIPLFLVLSVVMIFIRPLL